MFLAIVLGIGGTEVQLCDLPRVYGIVCYTLFVVLALYLFIFNKPFQNMLMRLKIWIESKVR